MANLFACCRSVRRDIAPGSRLLTPANARSWSPWPIRSRAKGKRSDLLQIATSEHVDGGALSRARAICEWAPEWIDEILGYLVRISAAHWRSIASAIRSTSLLAIVFRRGSLPASNRRRPISLRSYRRFLVTA
jgi:hypothetical protein